MKYFLLPFILIITACSLNKNSTYWNEDPIKKSLESKKLFKVLKKTTDFKKMTFDEFNILLIKYAETSTYPNIDK